MCVSEWRRVTVSDGGWHGVFTALCACVLVCERDVFIAVSLYVCVRIYVQVLSVYVSEWHEVTVGGGGWWWVTVGDML